jgi:hypothetical protein
VLPLLGLKPRPLVLVAALELEGRRHDEGLPSQCASKELDSIADCWPHSSTSTVTSFSSDEYSAMSTAMATDKQPAHQSKQMRDEATTSSATTHLHPDASGQRPARP